MSAKNHNELDILVEQVLRGSKYQEIAPELVRRIGAQELPKRRSLKEAVKATKNKLHQVGGAYQQTRLDYEKSLALLRETAVSPQQFRATCQSLMQAHASTRERLPILDNFYINHFGRFAPHPYRAGRGLWAESINVSLAAAATRCPIHRC